MYCKILAIVITETTAIQKREPYTPLPHIANMDTWGREGELEHVQCNICKK